MASLVWQTVFAFLVCELLLTLVLVVPVPRKVRNFIARECFQLNLGERLKTPILFIGVALVLALVESYFTHQRILARLSEEVEAGFVPPASHHDGFYPGLHDKERKYKSERNMYLAGFALTLLFVIGRITALLQESVELHEEMDRVEKDVANNTSDKTTKNASSQSVKQEEDKKAN
mmetsp:Transcript_17842/g.33075  ORF Transcript_17842/g.33075 Transcript_17842/m.33075 type:complete len:176 (-) Transcript_17842:512-1039(-)